MQVYRNREIEGKILTEISQHFFSKERTGIHLSDLLYPKQAYWQKVKPKPPTFKDVQYWVAGRGHEDAVHRIQELKHVPDRVWNGIYYGIDFFREHPIEMKTRRSYLAKEGEEATRYESYIAQLLGYCACENIPKGELWVWSLLEKKDAFRSAPEFAVYEIEFTQEELEDEKQRLIDTKRTLLAAIGGDDDAYRSFKKCPDWKCFWKDTQMIEPPHCYTCDKDFKTDWGIEQHLKGSKGKGHKTSGAKYKVDIYPECKWFVECKEKV